jgi:hypothetical protein
MFRVIMAKGRKLKKVIGDLEAQKQNVISSKLTIREQNVVPSKLGVDESSNPCGLGLAIPIMRSFPIQIGNFDRKLLG